MIIAVTNRLLCTDNFLNCIEKICKAKPDALILREKDLQDFDYKNLAAHVKKICDACGVYLFVNSKIDSAVNLNIRKIQLPFDSFMKNRDRLKYFETVAVSVHSTQEAQKAASCGASFLIAGHIFETACKKDIIPRGIEFLREITKTVNIPVIAIGGINQSNIKEIKQTGAKGICLMSSLMLSEKPEKLIFQYKQILNSL